MYTNVPKSIKKFTSQLYSIIKRNKIMIFWLVYFFSLSFMLYLIYRRNYLGGENFIQFNSIHTLGPQRQSGFLHWQVSTSQDHSHHASAGAVALPLGGALVCGDVLEQNYFIFFYIIICINEI
jgi:hypothetical protein